MPHILLYHPVGVPSFGDWVLAGNKAQSSSTRVTLKFPYHYNRTHVRTDPKARVAHKNSKTGAVDLFDRLVRSYIM